MDRAARCSELRARACAGALCLALMVPLGGCAGDGPSPTGAVAAQHFAAPTDCATCHPRQYQEWQGTMMGYAALSPTMNALEAAGNALTGGAFAAGGARSLLCQRCHAPISVALNEFPQYAIAGGRPSRDFAGAVGIHGLSCDFCHQVAHADLAGSTLGDGIANAALVLDPGTLKYGPFTQPLPNPIHASTRSSYLVDAKFCGSCHDVRLQGPDAVTGEPFLRQENAFTEWQQGPYATDQNPYGRVVTCQDCHMSAYPYAPPGTYFQDRASSFGGPPVRQVASHYFTGVDIALIDFPDQVDAGIDAHGLPAGQVQRRTDLLRAACTVALEVPDTTDPGATLPITVDVTNVGAGHNVPTGFSQERQVWIELLVSDADGAPIYRSGYLVDRAHPETGELEPDGNLDDEDLEDLNGSIDPITLEADVTAGPDSDQRPAANLGLVNFENDFKRVTGSADEDVFVPFLSNHMDNSHSLPPLQTVRVPYDVPLPDQLNGPLHIAVRLRFRAFPPRFLRMLAQARPDLVSELMVDRNRIVDMAEADATVPVAP